MTVSPKHFMRRIRHIHFVGIGGVGMSGIAEVFHNLGYEVSGSDITENSMVRHLRGLGIKIYADHQADHVAGAHMIVISTAIDNNNPEIIAAQAQRIPIVRRAEMLAELMRFKRGIAVAGTHGKTTTTSLVASVLRQGGIDPTYVIGGQLNSATSHARLGLSEYLVAEADESDASFLYLQPMISIVTNIDQDHLPAYEGDFERLKQAFVRFLQHLPFYGLAVLCIDDPIVADIMTQVTRPVLTYGEAEMADVRITSIQPKGRRTSFTVKLPKGIEPLKIELNLTGKHNVLNATAAVAIAWELGIERDAIQTAMTEFSGIGRRFQVTDSVPITEGHIMHIDDYGHHPNEIKATVQGIRDAWPGRRLLMVFQPHRYTRTRDLFEDFCQVLSDVDQLILLDVYPAGESPIKDADGRALARSIRRRGKVDPVFVEKIELLTDVTDTLLRNNDIFLTSGAGSIGTWAFDFLNSRRVQVA